jgi:3-oxoacyl-[acyl-carrier protein] reductase
MPTAFITGVGEANIAGAVAHRLAAAGYALILTDAAADTARLARSLATRHGVSARGEPLDVSDAAAIEQAFDRAEYDRPPPSVLVNAAGIARPTDPEAITPDEFDHVIQVNLRGTFFCCQAFCRRLRAAGRTGTVVNLGSNAAKTGGRSNGIHYAASKAGVASITRGLAAAYGPAGIRVNAVAPGIVDTPMTAAIPGSDARAQATALRRWGTPAEVAEVIAFLCGDGGSYMAGTTIEVDGGAL